jgi:hypothetical protein
VPADALLFSAAPAENSGVSLLGAVSGDEIRAAQVVTGVTMAAFIAAAVVPGLRQHAATIRWCLLALYLAAFGASVLYVLL